MTHRCEVLLAGATGTIGRATAWALMADGHGVTCLVRPGASAEGLPPGAHILRAQIDSTEALQKAIEQGPTPEVMISCIASRTGVKADAWAVDHDANQILLDSAKTLGVQHFVLLSAICVQRPKLAFQQAKLAFEASLMASGLTWTIVRPTAFFKSLSGQVARVMAGKPFLVFGDGRLTACKPISDRDLGRFLSQSLTNPAARNAILPIGGPGPAITPMDQVNGLSRLMGKPVPVKRVPLRVMDVIGGALGVAGKVIPPLRSKAELARIGKYYASESMLVWDESRARYDAEATPSFGEDTLFDYYADLLAGRATAERGEHAVFSDG